MCGIYGSTINYSIKEISSKLSRTSFRGPDFSKYENYSTDQESITFGHNRLAIIDLDPRSNQPFTYEDQIHIVFNGEIYNFNELKNSLIKKGYSFKTNGDTEVICAAYLEYGIECPKYFNGMFSFVIYDVRKRIFFGARDRLGQKPFYYYHSGKDFEFASQISAIQIANTRLSISEFSISQYLIWGYIPDPNSIYKEVKKLAPGHSFTFDLSSGSYREQSYWDILTHKTEIYSGTYQDAKIELSEILANSVKKRMISDVPLGVFLSGGIDSSIVAAFAQKARSSRIKTFSIKFSTKGYDESGYAQEVAEYLNTDHHTIECNYNEGLDLIQNFSHYYDEPFSDSSAIPSMLLAKYTRNYVTVALSGDGGDESFLGYDRYSWIGMVKKFESLPLRLRNIMTHTLTKLPHYKSKVVAQVLNSHAVNDAYMKIVTGGTALANAEEFAGSYSKYLYHNNKNIYERASDFDLKTYLNGDINTKVDRATMAYSLEARAPLMDHRVVEFAQRLPTKFKMDGRNRKRILKDVLYSLAPKKLFDRPKSGFSIPLNEWFRNELRDYVLDELNMSGLQSIPIINPKEVNTKISEHLKGEWNREGIIWNLLVLKQWMNNNGTGYSVR